MVHTEEQVKDILARATRELRDQLIEECKRADEAEFRRDVAEWALVGTCDAHVAITVSPEMLHQAAARMDVLRSFFAREAALQLLRESGLAFTEWAVRAETERYISRLEHLLRNHGVEFEPRSVSMTEDKRPQVWDRRAMFKGPSAAV